MSATGMDLINQFSFYQLNNASDNFRSGSRAQGFDNFKLVYPDYQHRVYKQIWIDRGSPQGNPEYGRQTFNDTDGLSSTMQEKAEAINRYLESVEGIRVSASGETRVSVSENNARLLVNDNWGYDNYRRDPHKYTPTGRIRDDYYPPVDTDKVWCPTTQDECIQVGVALTAVGVVAAGAYAVYQVFQAVKGAMS